MVKQVPWAIQFFNNPSDRVKMAAVKTQNPTPAIRYIKDPTDKMKYESVKTWPASIQYIRKSSEELQLLAVKKDGSVIKYIRKPASKTVVITAILKMIKDGRVDAEKTYEKYRDKYPDWAEWAVIGKSLHASGLLK